MPLEDDVILKKLAFQRGVLELLREGVFDLNVEKAIREVDSLIEEFTVVEPR